jgi:hypothetical protein
MVTGNRLVFQESQPPVTCFLSATSHKAVLFSATSYSSRKKWRLNISLHAMELWGFLFLMHIRKCRNFSKRLFLSPQQPVVPREEAQTVLVVKYYVSGLRDWNSLSMTEEFVHFYWM